MKVSRHYASRTGFVSKQGRSCRSTFRGLDEFFISTWLHTNVQKLSNKEESLPVTQVQRKLAQGHSNLGINNLGGSGFVTY